MKVCTKCGQEKPESEYYVTKDGKLVAACKVCQRAINQQRRRAHLAEFARRQREWRAANYEERLAYERAYREEHRESARAYRSAYRETHREEIRAYDRAFSKRQRKEGAGC